MWKPVLFMRKRSTFGPIFGEHSGVSGLSKSAGNFVELGTSGPDIIKPSIPQNLVVVLGIPPQTQTILTWDPAVDNVAILRYNVYRDGGFIGSAQGSETYTDNTALASTTYLYKIQSMDTSGNVSGFTAEVSITTAA